MLKKVHCPYCGRDVVVSKDGFVSEHRVGKIRCIGGGLRADQAENLADRLREIMPGSKIAEDFKKKG